MLPSCLLRRAVILNQRYQTLCPTFATNEMSSPLLLPPYEVHKANRGPVFLSLWKSRVTLILVLNLVTLHDQVPCEPRGGMWAELKIVHNSGDLQSLVCNIRHSFSLSVLSSQANLNNLSKYFKQF